MTKASRISLSRHTKQCFGLPTINNTCSCVVQHRYYVDIPNIYGKMLKHLFFLFSLPPPLMSCSSDPALPLCYLLGSECQRQSPTEHGIDEFRPDRVCQCHTQQSHDVRAGCNVPQCWAHLPTHIRITGIPHHTPSISVLSDMLLSVYAGTTTCRPLTHNTTSFPVYRFQT